MRYIINDDDFEQWIEKLEEVLESLEGIDSEVQKWTLIYVINEMKAELIQHKKEQHNEFTRSIRSNYERRNFPGRVR